jgi:hypothetical protein
MFKSLIFQLFTIWVYILFCCGILWCKILNLFVNMEWAIKLLYLAMNLICENVIKIEENWMNKYICSRHCAKVNEEDDDTESFDDFIKKIKNDTNQNYAHMNPNINYSNNNNNNSINPATQIPLQTTNNFSNNNVNLPNNIVNNSIHGNINSAHISTLKFPNPNGNTNSYLNNNNNSNNYNDAQRMQYHSNSTADEIDHDKIKRLIDKMYMKSIIEENEDDPDADAITNKASMFSRRSKERDGRQIIFSRGVREVENNVPEPNY